MTTAHLVTCEECSRHVRASEAACPFCGAGIAMAGPAAAPRSGPATRLSRAGLVAFGALVVAAPAALAGCAESAQMAVYGGPPPEVLDGGARPVPSAVPSAAPKPSATPQK